MTNMVDIKDVFSRKVGPLPVGLWVIGIGGGLFIATRLRRNTDTGGATTDPTAAEDYGLTGTGGGYTGTGGAAVSDPGYFGSDYGSEFDANDDTTTVQPPTNNNQWRIRALVAVGGGLFAQRAIDKYLVGKKLGPREQKIIEDAIRIVGPTPQPVPTPVLSSPAGSGGTGTGSTPGTSGGSTGAGSSNGSGAGGAGGQTGGGASGTNAYPNNATWRAAGVKVLVQRHGYQRPKAVQALAHYLQGDTLTTAQAEAKRLAIAAIGPPPYPPKPASTGNTVLAGTAPVPVVTAPAVPIRTPVTTPVTGTPVPVVQAPAAAGTAHAPWPTIPTNPTPAPVPAPIIRTPAPVVVQAPIQIAMPPTIKNGVIGPIKTRRDTGDTTNPTR